MAVRTAWSRSGSCAAPGIRYDAVVVQFALGPDNPLRHRGLRHEKRSGDLTGLQSGKEPQDERDLGVGGEGGMCAEEHEPELVIRNDIDEIVQPVELGIGVRVHAVGVESMGREMTPGAG